LLWAIAILWGSAYLLIKIGLQTTDPLSLVWLRLVIVSAVFGFVLLWKKGFHLLLNPHIWINGLLQFALPFTLIAWAETQISSGLTSILLATVPIWVLLMAVLWDPRERGTPLQWIGQLACCLGVGVLVGLGGGTWLGSLAALAGAVSYAGASLYAKKYLLHLPSTSLTGASILTALAWITPFAIWSLDYSLSLSSWAAIAGLGLLCNGLAFVLMYQLFQRVGVSRASLNTYLSPPIAVALGIVVLGESWTLAGLVGAGIIGGGMVLALLPEGRRLRRFGVPSAKRPHLP
jgi:drug/metabolite transporter (DMT)-like permease